jgi:hypothetical protein
MRQCRATTDDITINDIGGIGRTSTKNVSDFGGDPDDP